MGDVVGITDGEIIKPAPDFWDLPFARLDKRGEFSTSWAITPSGDYSKDWLTGEEFALDFLPILYTRTNGAMTDLGRIVSDMIKAGDQSGLVLGFMRIISIAASSSMLSVEHLRAWRKSEREYYAKCEAERSAEEHDRRSKAARKAAATRAARRHAGAAS